MFDWSQVFGKEQRKTDGMEIAKVNEKLFQNLKSQIAGFKEKLKKLGVRGIETTPEKSSISLSFAISTSPVESNFNVFHSNRKGGMFYEYTLRFGTQERSADYHIKELRKLSRKGKFSETEFFLGDYHNIHVREMREVETINDIKRGFNKMLEILEETKGALWRANRW